MAQMAFAAVIAICAIGSFVVASAQSSQLAPDCDLEMVKMATCLKFVTGSKPVPDDECCSGLKAVLASQPVCLCQLVSPSTSSGLTFINATLASELPGACQVVADASQCAGLHGSTPTPSPTSAPPPPPPQAAEGPMPPMTSGSPTLAAGSKFMLAVMIFMQFVVAKP